MAHTNQGTEIPFSHASPSRQRGFRLLELPPELLDVLEKDGDGDAQKPTLQLKSSPQPSTASSTSSASSDFVNLCTPTRTYFLRQVHSSNSIFVIHPSGPDTASPNSKSNANANEKDASRGITALAQCKSTLEVQPLRDKDVALRKAFRRAVRVYDVEDAEEDAGADAEMDIDDHDHERSAISTRSTAMQRVFADIPFSHAECAQSWLMHCAFVHGSTCYRPTAALKLFVWRKVLEASDSEGMDLGKQFLVGDLWGTVLLSGNGEMPMFPRDLFGAVVRRVMDGDDTAEGDVKWANIDPAKLVTWIGEVYLEATAPDLASGISRSAFLSGWRDLVPEKCRAEVSLDKMKDWYQSVDGSGICFKQSG